MLAQMSDSLPEFVNLAELEALARERHSPLAWDYYSSGADDETTLRENQSAFARRTLFYRVLVDVATRDLSTTILGERATMPILVAPTAFQRLAHPDGELASARAAAKAGTIFVLSTLATTAVEDVTAAGGPVWFQLYVYRDRGLTERLVRRVEAAGCRAIVLTVDAPVWGRRDRDVRNRFVLPDGMRIENLTAGIDRLPATPGGCRHAAYSALFDTSVSWMDLTWLRGLTKLPIVVKGIVRADDARRAIDAGAAGVVVSNHGGRQLDGAPATLDALGPIADAVAGRIPVFLDGGVRRGTDVVKALALGARAVLVGRPVLWGLALGGEAGVAAMLELLRTQLDRALALCGCPRVADVGPDLLTPG